jgi:hypothetical protein
MSIDEVVSDILAKIKAKMAK